MGQKGENTNMASEFLVMSRMFRLGLEPILTLGNKKDIDIVIRKTPTTYTIDVKGLKGKTNWPIGNREKLEWLKKANNHHFVFVSFVNKFSDLSVAPEVFVVPAMEAVKLAKYWNKQDQFSIDYKDLRDSKYKNAWDYFLK